MRFTKKQLEFMKDRFNQNKKILSYNPAQGWLFLKTENYIMKLLMDIHNAGTDDES